MKLYNKLAFSGLCLAFALSSCADNKDIAPKPELKSFSGFTTVAGMQFREMKEYGAEKGEARSLITRTENDIPKLSVNYLNGGLSIRTVVYTPNGSDVSKVRGWEVAQRNPSYSPNTYMGTGYTILNEDGSKTPDGNRGTRLAVSVYGGTTYKQECVQQQFGYIAANDPNNQKALTLAKHGSELSLPYPLTTQVREINGANPQRFTGTSANGFAGKLVNWVKLDPTRFHARGSLLGFKITNNTGFKLYRKGRFWRKTKYA